LGSCAHVVCQFTAKFLSIAFSVLLDWCFLQYLEIK